MLKQKMIKKKHLMMSLVVFSLLGCSQLPKPPDAFLCAINLKEQILVCKNINDSNLEKEVPLADTNNYLAMSPDDFRKLQDYIDTLKQLAEKQCKKTE